MRHLAITALWGCLALTATACGGGDGAVIGVGNSGNRFGIETLEEVAEALAENPETPRITDEMVGVVFDAILRRAWDGDPQAAMIVLLVAGEQAEREQERAEDG